MKIDTRSMDRQEWLNTRRKYIGGSDAGAILNFNKWQSPLDVYLNKIGESPDTEENEFMYWGNVLEEVVAKEFERRSGMKVRRNNFMIVDDEHPFMAANIDREVVGAKVGLECKTANAFARSEWENDGLPDNYYCQIQHYLAVTGYDTWYIAYLLGGNTFGYKEVPRNEDFIKAMIEKEEDFWNNHVLKQVPPPANGSQAYSNILKEKYKTEDAIEEIVTLDDTAEDLINKIEDCKIETARCKQQLQEMLGNNTMGVTSNYVIKWSVVRGGGRFNTKKFKEEHEDLYDKYLIQQKDFKKFSYTQNKGAKA